MTRVSFGEHLVINVSRRSLCDNCVADVCLIERPERVLQCKSFESSFVALRRCRSCGQLFNVCSNVNSLDFEVCSACNETV